MSDIEQTLSIIKPDAVERNLSKNIKEIFTKNNLNIKTVKKFTLQKTKLQSFIKCISQNPFITIFVHIYHLVQ